MVTSRATSDCQSLAALITIVTAPDHAQSLATLAAGADTYRYDALGRVAAIDDRSIAYGPDGQVDHTTLGATTVTYVYDESGRRLLKSVNGAPVLAYVEDTTVTPAELGLSYRHSKAPDDWIFTSARLRARPGDQKAIAARIAEIDSTRADSQPRSRTGGSTFANPPALKAWELIDRARCRGLRIGDAQVSEKHTNFLINLGNASAADIESLGEEVRSRVFKQTGVLLQLEIRRIGERA